MTRPRRPLLPHGEPGVQLSFERVEIALEAAQRRLALRERELLDLAGPCQMVGWCRLHRNHRGTCERS